MQKADSTVPRSNGNFAPGAACWDELLPTSSPGSGRPMGSQVLAGRRVLITGAGGSIGSAIALAVAASTPESLLLMDNSENGLYQVDRGLRHAGWRSHTALLGSVCNADTVEHTIQQHRPEIIFHAAALKHVPLMEQNPFAAIDNNVFGSHTLMEAAIAGGVEQIVLVSTDKAVEPCSIMGASKRIAELLLLSRSAPMRRTVVRLCNVIGSQGSVLPLFLEQIARGGPLTVTHPEVQRYLMTVEQAVRALFAALEVRAPSMLLLPEVGAALRIVDLARHLLDVHRSSATIEFTGLRPGDKLCEQLVSSREYLSHEPVVDCSILRSIETPTAGAGVFSEALETLREAVDARDLQQLLRGVWLLVPEYQPSSTITAALNEHPSPELEAEVKA